MTVFMMRYPTIKQMRAMDNLGIEYDENTDFYNASKMIGEKIKEIEEQKQQARAIKFSDDYIYDIYLEDIMAGCDHVCEHSELDSFIMGFRSALKHLGVTE